MALPTYVTVSTGATDATGAWTCTGSATVAGRVIILQVLQDGTGTSPAFTSATNIEDLAGTDNAWTYIGEFPVGAGGAETGSQHLWIGRALGTSAPTFTGANAGGDDLYFRMYQFSGVKSGTTFAAIAENTTAGATVTSQGTSATMSDAAVVTTAANRLALNFCAVTDDNPQALFTGMTGGTWDEVAEYADAGGTDGSIGMQWASMAAAGTIDGGTASITDSDGWGVVGFALIGDPPTSTSVADVGLATYTPATQTNHSILVRARVTSGAGTATLRAALYEGTTNRSGDLETAALTASLANYELAIPDASAANITDYSNLSIRFWGYDSGGAALTFEVDYLALEVPEADTGVEVTAGIATATGAANRPSAHVKPNAGSAAATGLARTPAQGRTAAVATATGAASQPSAHVKPSPAAAAATGAANRPSAGVKPSPAAATATGAANTPAQGRTAAVATATGAANRPAPNVKPTAGAASATGQAYDATASTATPATAGIATATGTANRPAAHVKPTPGAASATGQAYDATAAVGSVLTVNAGIASATGAANAVSAGVKPRPAVATATGAALTPSTARTAPTASAIAAAWGVTAKISVNASAATATGAANDATATDSGTPPPVVPPAGGRRRLQPQTRLEVHAGHATAHASAYGAGAWTDDSDTLLLTLLGITDFGVPL
jgi:hypothetical protein